MNLPLILSIETSCDETSIALTRGRNVLCNIVSSQIEIHKRFGGVVPEVASRNHVEAIDNVLDEALTSANVKLTDVSAVAVTYGAGLIGALMVGVAYAKSLAYALNVPLIKVNHIRGHLAANYINTALKPPFMGLIISGGHTAIIKVKDYVSFECIGSTVDDAIGEAYDKVARVLGLEYPGGPKVDKLACTGRKTITFNKSDALKDSFNISYSGLKTSVINYVNSMKQKGESLNFADICCSFQTEAVDKLIEKAVRACKTYKLKTLAVAGGVSANSYLRKKAEQECAKNKIKLYLPKFEYCTDNAAMIGVLAHYNLKAGQTSDLYLGAASNLPL